MKVIGIDYGTRRIGIAMADTGVGMAFARPQLDGGADAHTRIARICADERVDHIVVGLPLGMDGQETDTTRRVRTFVDALATTTGLPVDFMDERLSSAEASQRLHEAGINTRKQKKLLDSVAAQIILESWLASHR